jgi:uncharacterized protein (DUF952 family)
MNWKAHCEKCGWILKAIINTELYECANAAGGCHGATMTVAKNYIALSVAMNIS